ncbi:MAG: hypothetical protein ACI8V8_001484 [Chitinophagales bacterium]|jgi:hypothetical protein
MKAVFALILMIVFGAIASLFLPWWTIAVVCFVIGLTFLDKGTEAALIGFVSVFLVWGAFALIKSFQNDFIMLNRMSEVLPLHNPWLLLLVTAGLGGIIGMLSALSGVFLQTINEKPIRKKYYS